ncbi:MAG: tetratricopeptide repeat protein [Acidobacteriota bacterium]
MKNIFYGAICLFCISVISFSQDVGKIMTEADNLFSMREELNKAKEAASIYEKIIKSDPKNFEAHWKLAKTIYYIGNHSPEKERVEIFNKGVEISKKAIEINPDKAEGHFWLAVLYGVYGEARGVLKSLFLVDDIKEEANKSLSIDPNLEGAGAYRLLGRMYYKLPGIAGGSKEKSLEYLLKSKEMCPTNALTRIYLADTYLKLKKKEEAKKELQEVINMEPDSRWIPETKELKKKAEQMLREIK